MDSSYDARLTEWNASLTGDYLWSNVNFGEAVADVMTPLAWSVLRLVLAGWVFLPGYETPGNIGGRPYLNISILATVFRALGRNQEALLKNLEGTLFMRLPAGMDIPLIPISRWAVLSILSNGLRIQARQTRGIRQLPAFLAQNPAWFRRIRAQIRDTTTPAGLASLWREELGPHVTASAWIILGSAAYSADYTLKLRRELTELVGPDDASLLVAGVSGEDPQHALASLGPMVALTRVARGEMERETYVEQYGHRGPHEFELSVPRPAEDSVWIDQQLAQLRDSPVDVAGLLAQQRAAFDAARERFAVRHPHQARRMRRRLDESARRARLREAARSEYVRDRWAVRLFALRAGELTGLGDGVFFLTMADLLAVLPGDEAAAGRIPARKETYQRYKALPPYPSIIRGRFDPFQWAADPNRRSDVFAPGLADVARDSRALITGAPGSAGRIEGLVRRLDSPEVGAQLQPGEILVAAQTDIAWTLLFPRAAAVVTDVGAALSHAAIVARELGIPAVVGCGDATMRLQTGDRVVVDGSKGVVEILT